MSLHISSQKNVISLSIAAALDMENNHFFTFLIHFVVFLDLNGKIQVINYIYRFIFSAFPYFTRPVAVFRRKKIDFFSDLTKKRS